MKLPTMKNPTLQSPVTTGLIFCLSLLLLSGYAFGQALPPAPWSGDLDLDGTSGAASYSADREIDAAGVTLNLGFFAEYLIIGGGGGGSGNGGGGETPRSEPEKGKL